MTSSRCERVPENTTTSPGGGHTIYDSEAPMTAPIAIGFLALVGILFVAYILFLVEQHKLQDELARHYHEEEEDRWRPKERPLPQG